MKKIKIISAIIAILMILSCFSNFALIGSVNAAEEGYSVKFGTVEDGKVKVTVTFEKDLASDFSESNGWTKVDSKTIEATKAQFGYYMFTVNMSDGTQESVMMITPFELTEGQVMTISKSDVTSQFENIEITSADSTVLSVETENMSIKAVKPGTTTITVTASKDGKTGTLCCTGTVVEAEDTEDTSSDTDELEWTDFSNCTFEWNETTSGYLQYMLTIKNDKSIESHKYYVYINNNATLSNVNVDQYNKIIGLDKDDNYFFGSLYEKELKVNLHDFLALNNKTLYVTIIEEQYIKDTNTYKNKIVLTKQISRPNELNLGERMKTYFFSDYTSTYLYYPYIDMSTRKINLKIGKVTDNTILRNIMNKKDGCLQDLMEYAKNSTETIYTGTVALGRSEEITSNMNLVNGEYYYVYMEFEDEEGKYYPVEDVSLYQGLVGEAVGKNLFDYLSDDFSWNLSDEDKGSVSEEEKKEDTTTATEKLPQTGINQTAIIAIGIAVVASIGGYAGYRKYKGIK